MMMVVVLMVRVVKARVMFFICFWEKISLPRFQILSFDLYLRGPVWLLLLLLLLRMHLRLNLLLLMQLVLRRLHQSVIGIIQLSDVRAVDHFTDVSVDHGQVTG